MYFVVKTKTDFEDENGKKKTLTEQFLVKAVSPTDVEAKMYKRNENLMADWRVVSINETKIVDFIE